MATKKLVLVLRSTVLLLLLGTLPPLSQAQSITVSLGSTLVQWSIATGNPLANGTANNPGSGPVSVATTWTNLTVNNNLTLYAYFNSSTSALAHTGFCTGSCPDVPSSAIEVGVNGGARTSVTGTGPFGAGGASLMIFRIRILGNNRNGTRTDSLAFNINLSTLALPPDTYTGTLVIQAQMVP